MPMHSMHILFAIWLIYAGRSSFIQFREGSLVCGVYHWRPVLRRLG
jgi:hypothetical protein